MPPSVTAATPSGTTSSLASLGPVAGVIGQVEAKVKQNTNNINEQIDDEITILKLLIDTLEGVDGADEKLEKNLKDLGIEVDTSTLPSKKKEGFIGNIQENIEKVRKWWKKNISDRLEWFRRRHPFWKFLIITGALSVIGLIIWLGIR